MSWEDEAGIGELKRAGYFEPEIDEEISVSLFYTANNGTKMCANCGSKNIKTSKAGNEYCADLCWVDNSTERKV